ncbi:helix-turn-helix protein [Streptomyces sp. PanSC19]|uniref:helix-turn-helix domain-containing protein n=1 Tax=Streptomyces sp. PanSC19 TaxID=1520455 RepID=UPI000F490207|nr:helix-turn-helix transcriptional regulator [Streptomyces sp. PanSC19]ROQ33633.1 helix-turn-helix protein [Streptomyces sp. PanSC19]
MNNENRKGQGAAKAFGALLRFYRERAGVSQEALGKETGYSKSQVAMIERGQRRPRGRFVEIADPFLSAQGALLEVAEEVTASGVAAWFEDYLEEEAKAAGIHMYETHLIPGPLQTEEYARAVFHCAVPALEDEDIEAGVAARIKRQEMFFRKPAPLVTFVLEKAALTKPLGGPDVLRKNLLHVRERADLRNVTIQVMSEDRWTHAGLNGPFILLETEERRGQLVYVEGQGGRYFLSEQPDVGDCFARYSALRAQALTPEDSARLIEQVAREL